MTTTTQAEVMKELGLAQAVLAATVAGLDVAVPSTSWLRAFAQLAADPTRAAELGAVLNLAQGLANQSTVTVTI